MASQALARGARIRHVRLALAAPLGDYASQGRFGALVAAEEGRRRAYDMSTAKRWEDGSELGLAAVEAMARLAARHGIAYATRAWIAFGDEGVSEAATAPKAPPVEIPPEVLDAMKATHRHPHRAAPDELLAAKHPMPTVPVELPPEVRVRATPKKRGKGKRRSA